MSDSKRIIGSSEVTKDKSDNTYSIEYYLQESDLADYVPSGKANLPTAGISCR
jgi:hypothetical protein